MGALALFRQWGEGSMDGNVPLRFDDTILVSGVSVSLIKGEPPKMEFGVPFGFPPKNGNKWCQLRKQTEFLELAGAQQGMRPID